MTGTITGRITEAWAANAALLQSLGLIAGLWVASDLGYYLVLPKLSLIPDYNQSPVSIATCYFFLGGRGGDPVLSGLLHPANLRAVDRV